MYAGVVVFCNFFVFICLPMVLPFSIAMMIALCTQYIVPIINRTAAKPIAGILQKKICSSLLVL